MWERVLAWMLNWISVRYMYVWSVLSVFIIILFMIQICVFILFYQAWKMTNYVDFTVSLQLLKEDDISVLEILKLDVISSVYVPVQVCPFKFKSRLLFLCSCPSIVFSIKIFTIYFYRVISPSLRVLPNKFRFGKSFSYSLLGSNY